MSGLSQNSLLQKVKYSNLKNEIYEPTTEIIIPTMTEENKSSRKNGRRINNLSLKLMGVFIATIIVIIISYTLYSKIVPIETQSDTNNYVENTAHSRVHTVHTTLQNPEEVNVTEAQESSEIKMSSKNNPNILHSEFGISNHSFNTCVPLKNVEKVILMIERNPAYEYSCSDNATCQVLLQKFEQNQNGSSYNFVIGTGGELYVGLGFRCLMNSSESALYIKYMQQQPPLHGKQCLRISEVIEQGVSCGFISETFTLLQKDFHSELVTYLSHMDYHCLLHHENGQNRSLQFHDSDHEINTLIHGDVKWTVCGNYSHTTEVRKSRVITLESFPKSSCLPLNLANEISVDVTETQPFSCSHNLSCIQIFEENHEGFKYNFIIGHDNDIYVGLGFKCRAENSSGNVLRIRVLEPPGMSHNFNSHKERKFYQILEEGIACGKVAEYFSVKANCDSAFEDPLELCKRRYDMFNTKQQLDYALQSVFGLYNEEYYNITSEHGRGVVPRNSRFNACNRGHSRTDHTTVTPDIVTDIPSLTPIRDYDDYDYSYI